MEYRVRDVLRLPQEKLSGMGRALEMFTKGIKQQVDNEVAGTLKTAVLCSGDDRRSRGACFYLSVQASLLCLPLSRSSSANVSASSIRADLFSTAAPSSFN